MSNTSNIWVLKLTSGEEVIAKGAYDEKNATWQCERPMVLQVIPDYQTGQHRAGLVPFFLSEKDADCDFKDSHVVAYIEAPADVRNGYLKQTTGLEIAPAGSIIL